MRRHRVPALVIALIIMLVATSCDGNGEEIVITSTPGTGGSATAAATASSTPAGTSTAGTGTATSTSTGSPATATATSTPGAPDGYRSSCAAGYPWGEAVSGPFVCIETPDSGVALEDSVRVTGYAGGSFENNVIVEIRDANNVTLAQQPVTYEAPALGMPGAWETTMPVPPGQPFDAAGRLVARFDSPRDGGTVALDSIEVRFR